MLRPTLILSIAALIAFFGNYTSFVLGAAAGKGSISGRGARAAVQMSTKGASNSNAQWSADPVRGWVRADERHKIHEKSRSSEKTKTNDGKAKGKGQANKAY